MFFLFYYYYIAFLLFVCYNKIENKGSGSMFKEYFKFIKNYFKYTCTSKKSLIYMVLSASFYKGFSLLLPVCAALIIKYITSGEYTLAYLFVFFYAVVYLFYKVTEWINYEVYTHNMESCYVDLQNRILNKLLQVDEAFSKKVSKGSIVNSITSGVTKVGDMLDNISEFITTLVQILLVVIIVCCCNFYLGVLIFVYCFIYLKISIKSDKFKNMYHKKVLRDDDNYSNLLYQTTSGLQEIKSFNMLDKIKRKLKATQSLFTKHYKLKRKYVNTLENDVNFVTVYFRVLLYMILLFGLVKGNFTIDIFVLIISYHEYLDDYLYDFLYAASRMREEATSLKRINRVLNYKTSAEELFGENDTDDIEGIVEFKHVSFHPKNNKVLKNVSFKAKQNKILAIVGASGSGKTTIFNLLLRLYKTTKGQITIDGINIYDYSKEVYSNNVTIANQKPFIFNMSIRKNLDFVDKNIEHQIEACKKVGIHDFIVSLPKGYNTVLRENATNISGGQKQLISLARMLLSNAEIILLDDVSTSLDPDTAKMLPKLLKELKEDHTIIMITKKKELMMVSDEILVLDQGMIVAKGTHKELIKTNALYQNLNAYKSVSKLGVFDND